MNTAPAYDPSYCGQPVQKCGKCRKWHPREVSRQHYHPGGYTFLCPTCYADALERDEAITGHTYTPRPVNPNAHR